MSESIRAVERALAILLCFSRNTPELTLTQIAERVGLSKSTAHRLLATLNQNRFLQRDPATGAYRPGLELVQFAYLTLEQNDLRSYAAPFLHRLVGQYRETVNLTILDNAEVICLDGLESPQHVKLAATIGQRLPAFCTAAGKALLAFMDDETVQRILDSGIPKYTDHMLLTLEAFIEEMHHTRARGFAISEEEYEDGINAVAASILDDNGYPVAAIEVTGPAVRLPRALMQEIGLTVSATAREIASEIKCITNVPSHKETVNIK